MKSIEWTEEMISLLGKIIDQEFAKRFNISMSAIYKKRKELGIPRASKVGYGKNKHQWANKHLELIGTMSDRRLAKIMGVSKEVVQRERWRRGISSYRSQDVLLDWTPKMDALLGTDCDAEIAKKLDISKSAVKQRRQALGIRSYREQNRIIPEGMSGQSNEAKRLYCQRYRSRVQGLPYTLTLQEWKYSKQFFDYKCAYCNKKRKLTQDHIIPTIKSGGTIAENIIPACKSCNPSKGDKDWKPWIQSKFPDNHQEIIQKIESYIQSLE
jgi:5-methylcytosine-specific restriction endonuclease McrA